MNAGDIAKTRVDNPKDHLKRDQEVWVKVISLAGGRIRLSMRDVDQKTGVDMVPMGSAANGMLPSIPRQIPEPSTGSLNVFGGCFGKLKTTARHRDL